RLVGRPGEPKLLQVPQVLMSINDFEGQLTGHWRFTPTDRVLGQRAADAGCPTERKPQKTPPGNSRACVTCPARSEHPIKPRENCHQKMSARIMSRWPAGNNKLAPAASRRR